MHRCLELHERLLAVWVPTFQALLVYWAIAESWQPGQQYADPVLPCVFCATVFTPPIALIWLVTELVTEVVVHRVKRGSRG